MSLIFAATAPDVAVFVCSGLMIILGALGVVLLRNTVHCALSLVATLFGVAVAFIAQQADFLAAVQVIVYAGAVAVLFLFVIMLLGVDKNESFRREQLIGQRPLAVLVSFAILGLVVALAGYSWDATGGPSQGGKITGTGANIGKLADSIFTQYLFAFEATSVLLVIAVVGAVVLTRRPGHESESPSQFASTDDEPEDEDDLDDDASDSKEKGKGVEVV